MKKLLTIITLALVAAVGGIQHEIVSLQAPTASFGQAIPTIIALFETSLASNISSTASSITLVSGTDKQGNTLSGTYGFIIDEGSASEEFVLCSASSTALTSCTRGVSVTDGKTAVTALQKSHRRGSSIKITNYPQLAILSRILNGQENIPNKLYYPVGSTFTAASSSAIVDKNYIDTSVLAGCAISSTSIKGCVQIATVAQTNNGTGTGSTGARLVVGPSEIASSSWYASIPTANQSLALNGTLASPSATNKFLTKANIWGGILTASIKIPSFSLTASAQGDIFYQNASNQIVNLVASTSGTALISQGAGANPRYKFIGQNIVACSATGTGGTLSFTNIPAAKSLTAVFAAVTSGNNAVTLQVAVSSNNGGGYGTPVTLSASSGGVPQVPNGAANIYNTDQTQTKVITVSTNSNGTVYNTPGVDATTTGVTNAVQFSFSAGNFASGTVCLYFNR